MAKGESARQFHGCVLDLDLKEVLSIPNEVIARSLHREGILVGLGVRHLPDRVVRPPIGGPPTLELDTKYFKSHDTLRGTARLRHSRRSADQSERANDSAAPPRLWYIRQHVDPIRHRAEVLRHS